MLGQTSMPNFLFFIHAGWHTSMVKLISDLRTDCSLSFSNSAAEAAADAALSSCFVIILRRNGLKTERKHNKMQKNYLFNVKIKLSIIRVQIPSLAFAAMLRVTVYRLNADRFAIS